MNALRARMFCQLAFIGFLLLAAGAFATAAAAETGQFSGTWIANGKRTAFPFGPDRQVYTFEASGHVNLETALGKKKDYWAKCVGLSDSATGSVARCVWKDLAGPELYLVLQSDRLQQDNLVSGTIVGGTGLLAGVTGELSFTWSAMTFVEEASGVTTMTGQTLDLSGSYRTP